MERLTSNKSTSDMKMLELAYNSCYADEKGNARYRDYELDIDIRKLIKMLIKDMCNEDLFCMSDEEIDGYMAEMLSVEMDSKIGLLALFYRNLWSMADLRERLKKYEDLEEQGRLLKLPCKVGDDDYYILGIPNEMPCTIDKCVFKLSDINKIGKTLFLTREEAEAKLKELRGNQNGKV